MLMVTQPTDLANLIGVGYQGHDLQSLLAGLAHEGVSVVVDVRLTPISRKRGFSKRLLAEALADAGIGYRHLPELGNPKDNRAGFGGDEEELRQARSRFAARLADEPAVEALTEVARLASTQRVALLCFEADQRRCHRDVIAAALADPTAFGLAAELVPR